MSDAVASVRRLPARTLVLGAAAVVLTASLLVVVMGTMAWGSDLRDDQRLLPGTTVAGVPVGGLTVEEAASAARDEVAAALDREVTVEHDGRRWTTTPRDLGATSDVESVVATAFDRTSSAGFLDLAMIRFGASAAGAHDVALDLPDDRVDGFVAAIADEVDRAPRDAALSWVDGQVELQDAATGRRVARQDAATALEAAVASGDAVVALPVEDWAPEVGTDDARAVADEVTAAVDAALDRPVTLAIEDTERTITARELGATTNAPALLDAGGASVEDVSLELSRDAVHEVVDAVVMPHEVAATNAELTWSRAGGFASTPGDTGLAVDHQAAIDRVLAALQDGTERVAFELRPTQPDVTTDDFDEVLLVRQADRQVDLVRNGQTVRTWDVAVGTSGHATPTGMFTIGAKRHEPTWVNSSPDGWGSDMPARIGPGPGNPLGLRALNWMDEGRDTLIRFHGTANEASIGRAASHGCVRMTNPDVIELYDLVDTGTVIVSVAG